VYFGPVALWLLCPADFFQEVGYRRSLAGRLSCSLVLFARHLLFETAQPLGAHRPCIGRRAPLSAPRARTSRSAQRKRRASFLEDGPGSAGRPARCIVVSDGGMRGRSASRRIRAGLCALRPVLRSSPDRLGIPQTWLVWFGGFRARKSPNQPQEGRRLKPGAG
jgi:hypothetical protein